MLCSDSVCCERDYCRCCQSLIWTGWHPNVNTRAESRSETIAFLLSTWLTLPRTSLNTLSGRQQDLAFLLPAEKDARRWFKIFVTDRISINVSIGRTVWRDAELGTGSWRTRECEVSWCERCDGKRLEEKRRIQRIWKSFPPCVPRCFSFLFSKGGSLQMLTLKPDSWRTSESQEMPSSVWFCVLICLPASACGSVFLEKIKMEAEL